MYAFHCIPAHASQTHRITSWPQASYPHLTGSVSSPPSRNQETMKRARWVGHSEEAKIGHLRYTCLVEQYLLGAVAEEGAGVKGWCRGRRGRRPAAVGVAGTGREATEQDWHGWEWEGEPFED